MFSLDYRDGRAIYEQIKDGIRRQIIKGVLAADEQLPSVREIAGRLSINPNTIQRAYRELEQEGYIYSVQGRGSYVSPPGEAVDERRIAVLRRQVEEAILELLYLGIKADDIGEAVKNILYGKEVGKGGAV